MHLEPPPFEGLKVPYNLKVTLVLVALYIFTSFVPINEQRVANTVLIKAVAIRSAAVNFKHVI